MRALLLCIATCWSGYAVADNVSELLIPASLIGESIEKEVDWQVEDVDKPTTDFGKAIAGPLKAMDVSSSISVTYLSTANQTELYSLEIYEFAKPFSLDKTVKALKPGVMEKSTTAYSDLSGFSVLTIAVPESEIKLVCIQAESYLVIVGVVNDSSDIGSFAQKYIDWFAARAS